MKAILSVVIMLFSLTIFAQEQRVTYEKATNELVKATYYSTDNSDVIERIGHFNKSKQLHGAWVSYNEVGEQKIIANYENGQKHGEWFFYTDGKVKIVTYNFNKITDVKDKNIAVN